MLPISGHTSFWSRLFYIYLVIELCKSSDERSIIDLSYSYDQKYTPSHPAALKFDLRLVKKGFMDSGLWFYENDIFTAEHMGTHIDAPIHVIEGREAVDELSPYKLYRVPGIMIDLKNKIGNNKSYLIQPKDIKNWIRNNEALPDGAVVLFRTGWGEKASEPREYRGLDPLGRPHFPGLSGSTAHFLASYKNSTNQMIGIIGVGIDTISIDNGHDYKLPAHRTLLGEGIFALENLANLEQLPSKGFTLTILPMKIKGGSGAPTRVFAEINGIAYSSPQGSMRTVSSFSSLLICVSISFTVFSLVL